MITATAAQKVLDALEARINNRSCFTAYDVTTDARDATDERIDHAEVRNIVHNEWATGQFPADYEREEFCILDKAPGQPTAIMFYPDDKSPSDHPLVSDVQAVPVNVPNTTVPVSTNISPSQGGSTKVDDSTYECETTAEGRINIPKSLIDKVTPTAGTYDVEVNGTMQYHKKNRDGRIRLSRSSLGSGDKFTVKADTSRGVITVEVA